jgi:hypothetical protein
MGSAAKIAARTSSSGSDTGILAFFGGTCAAVLNLRKYRSLGSSSSLSSSPKGDIALDDEDVDAADDADDEDNNDDDDEDDDEGEYDDDIDTDDDDDDGGDAISEE